MNNNDTHWCITLISDLTWSRVERVTTRIADASRDTQSRDHGVARCVFLSPRKILLESVLLTVISE